MRAAVTVAVLLFAALLPAAARAGEAALAVTAGASPRLIRFDTDAPGTVLDSVAVGGLSPGETFVGLDVRPLTGQLFALTDTNRMLTIDPDTGLASQLGLALENGLFSSATAGGFDFNPAADRLRLVNVDDENLRFNPVTGTIVDVDGSTPGTQIDSALTFAAGDVNVGEDPSVVAVAYDRNDVDGSHADDAVRDRRDQRRARPSGERERHARQPQRRRAVHGRRARHRPRRRGAGHRLAARRARRGLLWRRPAGSAQRQPASGASTPLGPTDGELSGFTILPAGGLRATSALVGESAPSAAVTVSRSGDSLAATAVGYATQDGSATAGTDYTATSGTLAFARGQRTQDITVPLTGDAAVEGEEAFAVVLDEIAPQAALDARAAIVRITDDDQHPRRPRRPHPRRR